MDPSTERTLTALIYSALLDPSRWQVFLEQAAAEIDGARMQIHGWTDAAGARFSATTGYDPAMVAEYQRRIARLNPWTQTIIRARVGVILASQQLHPEEKVRKSLFFEEWIRPQENIIVGGGVVIGRTPSGPFMFGGNIRERDREAKHPRLLELLGRLAPHLTLAWRLGQSMLEPQIRLAAADVGTESSRAALVLLRPNLTVAFADERGAKVLMAEELCRIDHRGRFSLRHSLAQRALIATVRALDKSDAPVAARVPAVDGQAPVYLFGLDHDRMHDWPFAALLGLPQRSLLCVIKRSSPAKPAARLAGYGLTPAEEEVAYSISRGDDPATIAAQRQVSLATIRSQLKAIYFKCGVHNRAALTSLALGAYRHR